MVAYTGMYRIEGDKWITKVDVTGNPALVGTEQARFFRVDGDWLQEMTAWTPRSEKGMGRAVIAWERAKWRLTTITEVNLTRRSTRTRIVRRTLVNAAR